MLRSLLSEEHAGEGEEATPLAQAIIYGLISLFLVLFAGIVSGLSLGLMSQDKLDLLVLERSGTPKQRKLARMVRPVVENPHFTLVTLLLCNAIALEALPIFLRKVINEVTAVFLSVTVVLLFGEIIPQAICCRYGLVVGAYSAWLVKLLRWITLPVSWPISKLLDRVIGPNHSVFFKRQQLKAFVTLHSTAEGLGGKLSGGEVNVILGALDMYTKEAEKAMTPIDKVFMLSADTILDQKTLKDIVESGHSRVPVHVPGNRSEIVGVILAKELVTVDPAEKLLVGSRNVRSIPFLPASSAMFDVFTLFKTGRSHMAVLTKQIGVPENALDFGGSVFGQAKSPQPIGIITIEDIIEELLQDEIVDETDKYVDNLQTERINAAVMTSSLPPHLKKWVYAFTPKIGQLANVERQLSQRRTNSGRLASPKNGQATGDTDDPTTPLLDKDAVTVSVGSSSRFT